MSLFIFGLLSLSSAIPAGFTTFFDTIACPPGWFQPVDSQGRLILSVTNSADAGILVNKQLAEQEIRTHSHNYNVSVSIPYREITAPIINCCNNKGACSGTYSATGNLNISDGSVPFTQLILCQISAADASVTVPSGTVGYFSVDTLSCPTGWSAWAASQGRFLLSGYSYEGIVQSQEEPIKPGQDMAHSHTFKSTITTGSCEYLSDSACCNKALSQQGTYVISGSSSTESSNLPYISLLTCQYTNQSFASNLPSAALLFNSIACPPGWNISIEAAGRFLVSNPAGGTPGVSFGGKSLEPGFSNGASHAHSYSSSLKLPSCTVDALEGPTAKGYATANNYQYSGVSSASSMDIPFIAMPLCVQFK